MAEAKTPRALTINISHKTIFFAIFTLLTLRFIYDIREIIVILFISFLLAVAINPPINWLEKKRFPRALSSILILFLTFGLLVGTIVSLVIPLFGQTQAFINRLPSLIERLAPYNFDVSTISGELSQVPYNLLRIAVDTFSGLITSFTLIVVTFYVLQTRPKWSTYLKTWFGSKSDRIYHALTELEVKLGHWVRGEILLMLSVGTASYIGFLLIGLPFAIPLAVIAGILEIIPNLGPTIAAVPAAIVGFTVSPTHGFLTILISIIVQQLENHLLVPNIMRKTTGIHPVVTIAAILIGFRLGGPLLAILSLPIVISLLVVISHLRFNPDTEIPTIV